MLDAKITVWFVQESAWFVSVLIWHRPVADTCGGGVALGLELPLQRILHIFMDVLIVDLQTGK